MAGNKTTPAIPPAIVCDRYWSAKSFKIYKVFSVFGGLLDCFVIDIIVLALCLLLFSLLRRRAGNYGRLALHRRIEEGEMEDTMQAYNVWTTMFYHDYQEYSPDRAKHSFDKRLLEQDQGLFSWIPMSFRIKDADIFKRCGPDAMQYLTFQKYLIVYQLVVVVLALTIALPVNFMQGNYVGTGDTFARTTIINIRPNSQLLWIHCFLGLFLLCVAIIFMRHFIENVHNYNIDEESNTVMIRGIPRDKCFYHFLETHFDEAYPECEVTDIQFAYDVEHLIALEYERQNAKTALISSQITERETGERPRAMPYCCGAVALQCSRCCEVCGCKQVDAIDYYKQQLDMYQELYEAEKVTAFHAPVGVVFVSFVHMLMAKRENLSVGPVVWWIRALVINIAILLIIIFCTTPSVILNQLSRIRAFNAEAESNIVLQFIPTLFLTLTSALLPILVSVSDFYLVLHYTRTALNHAVMVKTYVFLLIMVLVLPSVGFSSVGTMIEWLAYTQRNITFRWNCIFATNNCIFYVNYLLCSSTIGIGLDLLRLSDLALYGIMWAKARSPAERPMLRQYILSEFRYGIWYAWILCIFTVNMAYSIISPIITIPGLIYLALKYWVDRHNLCFAYKSSKIDNRIHEAAINYVMTSVFCLELTVMSFILLRADKIASTGITGLDLFALVTLVTLFVLFLLTICFGKLKPPRPSADAVWKLPQSVPEVSKSKLQENVERVSKSKESVERRSSFIPPVLEEHDDDESYIPTNLTYATSKILDANETSHSVQRKSSSRISSKESQRNTTMKNAVNDSTRRSTESIKSGKRERRRSKDTASETDDAEQRSTSTEYENK